MLNKMPNNYDVTCIAYIVLNEASNSSEAPRVANKEVDLPEMRDNDMITRRVRVDRNMLGPGKEWRLYAQ